MKTKVEKVELGDRVKDNITGFTGIAVGRTQWLSGCDLIVIQPEELEKGKVIQSLSFDEPTVKVIKKKVHLPASQPAPEKPEKPGGPRPEPQRRPEPTR